MSKLSSAERRKRIVVTLAVFSIAMILGVGVFAKNGWFPQTDPMTGARTGWFGAKLAKNAPNKWNPLAVPSPTPTPQLAKEYIYAGSRLLAVEDAGANAAPPADLAVWRPSSGTWFVLGGPGSAQTQHNWGMNGDVPVPGDYDGDGKTDFAIFRPSTGAWWIVRSSDSTTFGLNFGALGDKVMAADFDGDGLSDQVIFRGDTTSGNATWFINRTSGAGVITQQFGLTTDEPAPADLDGDGKADINVWRNSSYTFYTLFSSNASVGSVGLGTSAGQPVPADYDGDGKANYAVKTGNVWAILNSTNTTITSVAWYDAGDTAVQNDYDGDGIVDIAVWRPVESQSGAGDLGVWYIRQSSKLGITGQTPTTLNPHPNELRATLWGTTGDRPVPAFYRR